MPTHHDDIRPPIDPTMGHKEFARWYWSIECLHAFCEKLELSKAGTKAELRSRVGSAIGGAKPKTDTSSGSKPKSRFNWSKEVLDEATIITGSVSFGPNVRSWFRDQIGPKFVCHGDFMNWVKSNTGATLGDAVEAWHALERRKADPAFRREIAVCNNYLRYLRAIRDQNPELTAQQAMECWHAKKLRPAVDGMVVYEETDLRFLEP